MYIKPGKASLSCWNHPDEGSPAHGPIGLRNLSERRQLGTGNVCVALGNACITQPVIDKILTVTPILHHPQHHPPISSLVVLTEREDDSNNAVAVQKRRLSFHPVFHTPHLQRRNLCRQSPRNLDRGLSHRSFARSFISEGRPGRRRRGMSARLFELHGAVPVEVRRGHEGQDVWEYRRVGDAFARGDREDGLGEGRGR